MKRERKRQRGSVDACRLRSKEESEEEEGARAGGEMKGSKRERDKGWQKREREGAPDWDRRGLCDDGEEREEEGCRG